MTNIEVLNPWWKGKEFIARDKHILDLKEKEYQWRPELLEKLKLIPNNIFTLRGPRQVGKTTLVKLLIKNLLEKVNEKAIFFWNCDELIDFRELSSLLREYLNFAEIHGIKEKFIFLDEISRVKNWQRAIKFLADSGELRNCCLLLTGSHTLDIKYGMGRLPGRTGKEGKDLMLLPMSFSEFVNLIKPDLNEKIKKIKKFELSGINKIISSVKVFDSELKVLFSQYLITGGFPLVINEFLVNKKIPEYVYELYFKWVAGDIVKWGKQEKILIQLMKSVILKQSSAISWDSLAKDAEIKSHKTVSSYVETLEGMFVLVIAYFLELSKKVPDYNKNKKIYFLDPFIYHVFNQKIYFKENEISPELIESVVITNLMRISQGTFYWKGKKEVDFLLRRGEEVFPIEIKYQNKIFKQDYAALYSFNRGILVTKNHLDLGNKYSAIPAHLMLAVI